MEKMQEKGEVAEEELRALEEDITGRVSLLSVSVVLLAHEL